MSNALSVRVEKSARCPASPGSLQTSLINEQGRAQLPRKYINFHIATFYLLIESIAAEPERLRHPYAAQFAVPTTDGL